jgi:hypothetical protein
MIAQDERQHGAQDTVRVLEQRANRCSLAALCRIVDSEGAEADAVEAAEGSVGKANK